MATTLPLTLVPVVRESFETDPRTNERSSLSTLATIDSSTEMETILSLKDFSLIFRKFTNSTTVPGSKKCLKRTKFRPRKTTDSPSIKCTQNEL